VRRIDGGTKKLKVEIEKSFVAADKKKGFIPTD
jgi:hypothetical protein